MPANHMANGLANGFSNGYDPSGDASYQSILGPTGWLWHSQLGVALDTGEVQSWTDQVLGFTQTAPSSVTRPTYVADGTNFRGLPVIGIQDAADKRLALTPTPSILIPTGSRPWLCVVGRIAAFPAAGSKWLFRIIDAGQTTAVLSLRINPTQLIAELAGDIGGAFSDTTSVHTFEAYLTAAGVQVVEVDGVVFATGGTGLSTAIDADRVSTGNNAGSVADAFIALAACRPTTPPDAQRAQFRTLAKAEFGY